MQNIYITGHKNPDMDSICSAYVYAQLKNTIDKKNNYIPARCGRLNVQTKEVFKRLGISPPEFVKDFYPRVSDIVSNKFLPLTEDEPVITAMKIIKEQKKSIIPIFSKNNGFAGLISVNEISDFLLTNHTDERPIYDFNITNFQKVLLGSFYKKGVLEEFRAPIMIGAMSYENCMERINALKEKPLLIVGYRKDLLTYAIEKDLPAIIITGPCKNIDIDFSDYQGTVFISKHDTAETTRLLGLSSSVKGLMTYDYPRLDTDDLFDDAKKKLVNSELRGLPVFSENEFSGTVTRRCFIERPRKKLIMVDHNEAGQSVNGIENCEITEILDHHRFAAEKTRTPIYIAAIPVGSTCTIVYQQYLLFGLKPTQVEAELLISGILSDTVILKSPTTTATDIEAIETLSEIAGIDWQEYGRSLFDNNASFKNTDPERIITNDFKIYEEYGYRIGIGQFEVISLQNFLEIKESLIDALKKVNAREHLNWTMILITNVLSENSILLTSDFPRGESRLIYQKKNNNEFFLPGILSRKKQLLPEILRVLEDI